MDTKATGNPVNPEGPVNVEEPPPGGSHDPDGGVARPTKVFGLGTGPLVLGCAALALGLFGWRQLEWTGSLLGFPLDDSYIHLQFAERMATGQGLSFRDAEGLVAGSTSPLWTALLTVGFTLSGWLGAPVVAILFSKTLGVLLFAWAGVEASRLVRLLGGRHWAAACAGVACVTTDTLVFSALSGMEVPLFVALTVRGVRCFVEEQQSAGGGRSVPWVAPSIFVLALACLARPEGLLLLGLALMSRTIASLRAVGEARGVMVAAARAGLLAAVLLAPVALLFWSWHGSALPTTFAVKAGAEHRLWPSARDAWRFGEVFFRVQPWLTLLAAAGALRLLRERRSLLPVLWVLALPLVYSAMTAPEQLVLLGNFGRYAFPLLPFVIVLGCLALDEIVRALEGDRTDRALSTSTTRVSWSVALPVLLTLVALWPGWRATWIGAQRAGVAAMNVAQTDVAAAIWVQENRPSARVGAQDIGALGFYTDNELVDLVGLVNPEILEFTRRQSGGDGLSEYLARRGVDHLLLFPASYGGPAAVERRWPGLVEIRRWRTAPNVAMAADDLVLYRLGTGPGAANAPQR